MSFHAGPVPLQLRFQYLLSAAEGGARSGDTADGFFNRIASAGGGKLHFAFAAVQGGPVADDSGDSLVDGAASAHRAVDAVAGAAVEGRTGADLAVDGFINDRTIVIVMLTHMLLLIVYFSG